MANVKIKVERLSVHYGNKPALTDVSLDVYEHRITAVVGGRGSGKSALLRALNRMNDPIPDTKTVGKVLLDGKDVYSDAFDPIELRRRVGMVFWKSKSVAEVVYDDIARLVRNAGYKSLEIKSKVESALRDADLWDAIKEKLNESPKTLSELEWMKLSLARTVVHDPEVIVLDEPFDSTDEAVIENMTDTITNLKNKYTVILATRNSKRAQFADYVATLSGGKLMEVNES